MSRIPATTVEKARELYALGLPILAIARTLGICWRAARSAIQGGQP